MQVWRASRRCCHSTCWTRAMSCSTASCARTLLWAATHPSLRLRSPPSLRLQSPPLPLQRRRRHRRTRRGTLVTCPSSAGLRARELRRRRRRRRLQHAALLRRRYASGCSSLTSSSGAYVLTAALLLLRLSLLSSSLLVFRASCRRPHARLRRAAPSRCCLRRGFAPQRTRSRSRGTQRRRCSRDPQGPHRVAARPAAKMPRCQRPASRHRPTHRDTTASACRGACRTRRRRTQRPVLRAACSTSSRRFLTRWAAHSTVVATPPRLQSHVLQRSEAWPRQRLFRHLHLLQYTATKPPLSCSPVAVGAPSSPASQR